LAAKSETWAAPGNTKTNHLQVGFPPPAASHLQQALAATGDRSSLLGPRYLSPANVRVGWQIQAHDDLPRVFVLVGGFASGLSPDQAVGFLLDLATAIGVSAPGEASGLGLGEAIEVLLAHGREIVAGNQTPQG
jgi:hypothetical protein